jgi:hypothetical protein
MATPSFLGPMIWFTGVVEDINDPQELGRTKVRCYGYHTDNKDALATEDLPWASPIVPITSSSMSGVGTSATGLQPGSWVVGFFKDGQAAQDPVIFGSIPSISTVNTAARPGSDTAQRTAFADPSGINPLKDGNDIPGMATREFQEHRVFVTKQELRQEGIPTAIAPGLAATQNTTDEERKSYDIPDPIENIQPVYPFNHVTEYSSGHVLEVDDRQDYSRISKMHKSGTYEEIIDNGDRILTVVNDDYEVTFKNKNMYVKGNVNLTVDGNIRQLCNEYYLECNKKHEYIKQGSFTKIGNNNVIEIGQDYNINVGGESLIRVNGSQNITVLKNLKTTVTGDSTDFVSGNNNMVTVGNMNLAAIGGFSLGGAPGAGLQPLTLTAGPAGMKFESTGPIIIDSDTTLTEKAPLGIFMN